jgi:hypothetical protein
MRQNIWGEPNARVSDSYIINVYIRQAWDS